MTKRRWPLILVNLVVFAGMVVLLSFATKALMWQVVGKREVASLSRAPTPTPDTLPHAQPSPDWQLVDLPGWVSQPGFSLILPPGWEARELQGIDSYVGEVAGDGVRLGFDYGAYSSSLVDDGDPDHFVIYETIGRHQAKLVRPQEGKSGLTGVYFRSLDGPALQISGMGLTPQQQETVFAIFRSIRSLGGLVKLRVTFHPQGVTLPPGTPAPSLLIDALQGDRRILASESDVELDHLKDGGVRLHDSGQYDRWLGPGTYILDINHMGKFTSGDVPRTVTVEMDGKVEMDINIYTSPAANPSPTPTPAQYDLEQLSRWYDAMRDGGLYSVPGVSWTDLDEVGHRIAVGMIPRRGAREKIEAVLASLGIPREAVALEVGCRGGGLETPGFEPDEQLRASLRLSLEAPSEVRFGATAPLKLRVKNVGDQSVTLELGGHESSGFAGAYEFVVARPDGTEVWRWRCGRIFLSILTPKTLKPGEELEFVGEWEQVDNDGTAVPPGPYLVRGALDVGPFYAGGFYKGQQRMEVGPRTLMVAP
ncbi:MAG: BsuPI-related putative proteinase inhibitor [Chloroflexota bacterium]|nr:BsuPI-related putative proteinase inhibitor [Chloroflexota bacterium]